MVISDAHSHQHYLSFEKQKTSEVNLLAPKETTGTKGATVVARGERATVFLRDHRLSNRVLPGSDPFSIDDELIGDHQDPQAITVTVST